jgi:hypothetical protein
MYQIIGVKKALGVYAITCGVFIAVWSALWQPTQIGEWWRIISGAVSILGMVTAVLGQSLLFPFLCQRTFLGRLFPPIDGEWKSIMITNWPKLAKLHNIEGKFPEKIEGKVRIVSRLFYVHLQFSATSRYSTSRTVFVHITKSGTNMRMYYVYENTTRVPKTTDSDHHFGGAYLEVIPGEDGELRLEGLYWTNRNWTEAKNPAGEVKLTRLK